MPSTNRLTTALLLAAGITLPAASASALQLNLLPATPVPVVPVVPMATQGQKLAPIVIGADIDDYAPAPDACAGGADSYLEPGATAYRSLVIQAGEFTQGGLSDLLLQAYVETLLYDMGLLTPMQVLSLNGFQQAELPQGVPAQVLGEPVCVPLPDGAAAYMRLVQTVAETFWALERLHFPALTFDPAILDMLGADDQDQPHPDELAPYGGTDISMAGLTVRTLLPGVVPSPVAVDTADEIAMDPDAQPAVCPGGAPSFLGIGSQVSLDQSGYMRFFNPLDSDTLMDAKHALDAESFERFIYHGSSPLLETPRQFSDPYPAVALSWQQLWSGSLTPTAQVVDGPVCYAYSGESLNDELSYHGVQTQWQIAVQVGGVTYHGWYAESVLEDWRPARPTIPRAHFLYYMTPAAAAATLADIPADTGRLLRR